MYYYPSCSIRSEGDKANIKLQIVLDEDAGIEAWVSGVLRLESKADKDILKLQIVFGSFNVLSSVGFGVP